MIFGYEFRKLTGARFVLILTALLFLANIALAFLGVETEDRGYNQTVASLCEEYNKDQVAGAENLEKQLDSVAEEEWSHLQKGDDEYRCRNLDGIHSDRDLLVTVRGLAQQNDDFTLLIEQTMAAARRVMVDGQADGLGMGDYTYRFAAHTYNRYEKVLKETEMKVEPCYGWEALFSFRYTDVFLFASLLLIGSVLFINEKQQGMLPILRASKRGRGASAFTKVGVMGSATVVLTLLFTASTYAVVFLKSGFSSAAAPVQYIEELRFFPYVCTVGQFFRIMLGLKLAAALAFSMLLLLLSVLLYQPALYTLAGLLPPVLSFAAESSKRLASNAPVRFFNLLAVARTIPLGSRLRSVNLLGVPVDYVPFALLLCLIAAVIFGLLTVFLFARGTQGVTIRFKRLAVLRKKFAEVRERLFSRRKIAGGRKPRVASRGLFLWESTKLLRFGGLAILLVLLLLVQLGAAVGVKQSATTDFRRYYYRHIIEGREGPLDEAKAAQVHADLDAAQEVIRLQSEYEAQYAAKQIKRKEYVTYLEKLQKATSELEMLQTLEHKTEYLEGKYEETGVWGWFADTEGYERYFGGGFILPTLAAILLIGGYSFGMEYTGKSKLESFFPLLRSTRGGRQKTFARKLLSVALFSLLTGAIFTAAELLCYLSIYDFPRYALDAPLFTMELFENVGSGITIGEYLIFYLAARVMAALLFGLFCAAVSALACRLLPTFNILALAAGVPSLLALLCLRPAKYANLAGWLGVQDMALFSFEADLFGREFGVFALFTTAFLALTVTLLLTARRKFVK